MNFNRAIILGRLTGDPEVRMTGTGTPVASLGIATNRFFKDKAGQRQEQTEFHRVVLWSRQAEIARDYLKKGQLVLIEGRIQTRTWEGKDGQKKYTTEIVGENMQLGPKAGAGGSEGGGAPRPAASSAPAAAAPTPKKEDDADIPVIDEDTVMDFADEAPKQVDPSDIPF